MALATGARGLRTILEDMIMDLMYEVPSRPDIGKIIITEKAVNEKEEPTLVFKKKKPVKKAQ